MPARRSSSKAWSEQDFKDLAEAGVTLLGESARTVKAGEEAARMVGWARKYGIRARSTPAPVGPRLQPDRQGRRARGRRRCDRPYQRRSHRAAGKQICELCARSSRAIEIVHNGNEKAA